MSILPAMPGSAALLLLLLLMTTAAMAKIRTQVTIDPSSLHDPVPAWLNVTVRCVGKVMPEENEEKQLRTPAVMDRVMITRVPEGSPWTNLVQITGQNPKDLYINPEASVHSGSVSLTHDNATEHSNYLISLVWEGSVAELARSTFRCDASVFDKKYLEEAKYIWSRDKISVSDLTCQSFAQIIEDEKNNIKNLIDAAAAEAEVIRLSTIATVEETRARANESLANITSSYQQVIQSTEDQVEDDLMEAFRFFQNESRLQVQNIFDQMYVYLNGTLSIWPEGSYALPTSLKGCPSGALVSMNATAPSNSDVFGYPTMLRINDTEEQRHNFAEQQFCVKQDPGVLGPKWPAGKYCINKYGDCPFGFRIGRITWWNQTDDWRYPPHDGSLQLKWFYYCCRHDGDSDRAIELPRDKPFYLYPREEKCQRVVGMTAKLAQLRFNRENPNLPVQREGLSPGVSLEDLLGSGPRGCGDQGGTCKVVAVEMCYYQTS